VWCTPKGVTRSVAASHGAQPPTIPKISRTRRVIIPFCVSLTIALAALLTLSLGYRTSLVMALIWAALAISLLPAVLTVVKLRRVSAQRGCDPFDDLRRSLRRGLHDGLGPTITTASMRIETARSLLREDPTAADALLAQAYAEMRDVVTEMRELIARLNPRCGPSDQALPQSLRGLAAKFARASGHELRIRVECPPVLRRITPELKQAAYFIISEALTNVAKHAKASECLVKVTVFKLGIRISVADNGAGCPVNVVPGVGTVSMRERASELGGSCSVKRGPAGGTEVRAFLPYQELICGTANKEININGIRERSA
jgi:signal transduction histidine kinase